MKFVLETPRLLLRELAPVDAEHFFELNNDPEVIRHTGDKPFPDVASAKSFLENYDQYARFGYGRWAVILKDTGQFIGWCGLRFSIESKETDLGFRFFQNRWGTGFATEASTACVRFGFEKLGLERIVGKAMKENYASIRVLEKCGFRFLREIDFDGKTGVLYEVTRIEFTSGNHS